MMKLRYILIEKWLRLSGQFFVRVKAVCRNMILMRNLFPLPQAIFFGGGQGEGA